MFIEVAATISLLLLGVPKPASVPGCQLADKRVESLIARKAAELHGIEYCQYRLYNTMDDLEGDGANDFVVVFTVEGPNGSNGYKSFMAVFLSSRKPNEAPVIVPVGGKGERDPIKIHVQKGKINLETMEYLPSDALCCPSGRGTLVFHLIGKELRAAGKPSE